jgi:hypothetical protein
MWAPSVNLQDSLVSDKRPTEAEAGSRRRVVEIDKDASPDEAAPLAQRPEDLLSLHCDRSVKASIRV